MLSWKQKYKQLDEFDNRTTNDRNEYVARLNKRYDEIRILEEGINSRDDCIKKLEDEIDKKNEEIEILNERIKDLNRHMDKTDRLLTEKELYEKKMKEAAPTGDTRVDAVVERMCRLEAHVEAQENPYFF